MDKTAVLIGNSDGIGLAATGRLLEKGWRIIGVSRSETSINHAKYTHHILDVGDPLYLERLKELVGKEAIDLCIYFVGVGELLDLNDMTYEAEVIDVNLTGMIRTAAVVIPRMVTKKQGHFLGISSMADELVSPQAPSYHASKAGFSNYLEGLAIGLKGSGVKITNIRFGFVDTKMAKGDRKPFMMGVQKAVDHIETCIRKKPVRHTAPGIMIPLIKLAKLIMKLKK